MASCTQDFEISKRCVIVVHYSERVTIGMEFELEMITQCQIEVHSLTKW